MVKEASAMEAVLYDWNSGSGKSFPNWTWYDDVAYGHPGWIMDSGQTYSWGPGPRNFEKDDYGSDNLAQIDLTEIAPSTNTGGSFNIYETGSSGAVHLCSWWVWYDGQPMSNWNKADADTNRWSFYLKTTGMEPIVDNGAYDSILNYNYHIGTYICWNDGRPVYGTGDGCPYEGPGNQHYYHLLTINPDTWLHVLLNNHPNHRRSSSVLANDPTFFESGRHYLEHLNQFYMEIRNEQQQSTNCWIDEMRFYSTKDTEEPAQNESSITSLWVGYWPSTDYWEIGWQDMSWDDEGISRDGTTQSTFEARYSTSPITNENYNSATQITPLFYSGAESTGSTANLIRRPDSWSRPVWTRFTLPDAIETAYNRIYFAVKDVSAIGDHVGTTWPWTVGDGHNAPSAYIHTIDYYIRPDTGCSYTLSAKQTLLTSDSASGSIDVTTPDSSCSWSASSDVSWINITSQSAQTGNATVSYTLLANTDVQSRSGTITIDTKQVAITQSGTFSDVSASQWSKSYIENIYVRNITSGCASGSFCPLNNVTRAEMAVFIIRAMTQRGIIDVANTTDDFIYSTTPYFTDVADTHWAFKWIQKLMETGVTAGCTATEFCPDAEVTRGQMAAFIVKALFGANPMCDGETYCDSISDYFADVSSADILFKYIQKFKDAQITSGCTSTNYCPDDPVTREQMAVFITKGFLFP
ncbi:S-layer homology region domain protein [Candidatus Magnetoovum chiemensis]|nr:S-layer homology region domain protein [Candidatus Magnetoovum chiemensis]